MNEEMQSLLFFSSPVLLLAFIVSIVQFALRKANKVNTYLAIFTIKPVLITPIWAILLSILTGIRFNTYAAGPIFNTDSEWMLFVCALPAIIYSTIAAYCMRKIRNENCVIFWLVIAVDTIRWMLPNTAILMGMDSFSKVLPPIDYLGIWIIGCGITASNAFLMLVLSIVFFFRK